MMAQEPGWDDNEADVKAMLEQDYYMARMAGCGLAILALLFLGMAVVIVLGLIGGGR